MFKLPNTKEYITADAPKSKSFALRVLLCSLFSSENIIIENYNFCEDEKSGINVIKNLGLEIETTDKALILKPLSEIRSREVNCGESGFLARTLPFVLSVLGGEFVFTGSGTLAKRQMNELSKALDVLNIKHEDKNGFLPLKTSGKLKSGVYILPESNTSQILSGILISLSQTEGDSIVYCKNLKSRPYIDMTLSILQDFGVEIKNSNYETFEIKGNQSINGGHIEIEGDFSAAAYLAVYFALGDGGQIRNLNQNSNQADKAILEVFELAGIEYIFTDNILSIKKSRINQFEFDASMCPDLIPALAVLAFAAEGKSIIQGAKRLINKESDRGTAILNETAKLGGKAEIVDNSIIIYGKSCLTGGIVSSHSDHRIAMALAALAQICSEDLYIDDVSCINKSFPDFISCILPD